MFSPSLLRGFSPGALLLFAHTVGCATIVRPERAELILRNPPPDLQVIEDGHALALQADGPTTKLTTIGYKTRQLVLRTGGTDAAVELDTNASIGYLAVDYLLFVFPIIIDLVTSKWTNFGDVNVPAALALAKRHPMPAVTQRPPLSAQPSDASSEAPGQQWIRNAAGPTPVANPQALPAVSPRIATRTPAISSGKLAVLDFKSYTDQLKPEDVRYFTDVVRGATLKTVPALEVITRENLLVLLRATGKDAANCEGECEVDTGRRIGADAVISGDILKVGSRFKMSLRLHETHEGRLLSTSVASGKSIDELDESAQQAAADLLAPPR